MPRAWRWPSACWRHFCSATYAVLSGWFLSIPAATPGQPAAPQSHTGADAGGLIAGGCAAVVGAQIRPRRRPLHVRLVTWFSVIAVVPAILVAYSLGHAQSRS